MDHPPRRARVIGARDAPSISPSALLAAPEAPRVIVRRRAAAAAAPAAVSGSAPHSPHSQRIAAKRSSIRGRNVGSALRRVAIAAVAALVVVLHNETVWAPLAPCLSGFDVVPRSSLLSEVTIGCITLPPPKEELVFTAEPGPVTPSPRIRELQRRLESPAVQRNKYVRQEVYEELLKLGGLPDRN